MSGYKTASLAFLLAFLPTVATAETYRDPARHFSIEIPPGWREMPSEEVEALNRARGPARWTPKMIVTTAFRPKDAAFGTGPVTMILAYEVSALTPATPGYSSPFIAQQFAAGPDGMVREKEGTLLELAKNLPIRDMLREGPLGGGVVDKRHRIINRYRTTVDEVSIDQLSVIHQGRNGFVAVQSQYAAEQTGSMLPLFVEMNDTFRFDEGHEYPEAAPAVPMTIEEPSYWTRLTTEPSIPDALIFVGLSLVAGLGLAIGTIAVVMITCKL